jgi:DNA polymerase-1
MTTANQTLLIIDCFALIHRAFHAFPDSLVTRKGELVNVSYGFTSLVIDTILKFKPTHVICVFDPPGPTIRNSQFADYKANRGPADEGMIGQLPRVREIINLLGIPLLEVQGYEADDVIGTLTAKYERKEGNRSIIVTGDRDIFQLVDANTNVYLAGSSFSQSKIFDTAGVKEKMGVLPTQIVDFKGLAGDASDNIPGVPGIGAAGAATLISQFESLDGIYKRIDEVPNRYKQKLIDGHELAYLSQKLAQIIQDVPLSFDFEVAKFGEFLPDRLRELFVELEFKSLLTKLTKLVEQCQPAPAKPTAQQDFFTIDQTQSELFQRWDGEPLVGDLFVYFTITGEDPPTKKLQSMYILNADKAYMVDEADYQKLFAAWKQARLISADIKSLYQICAGDLDDYYDIVIADSVISGGLVRARLDDVLLKVIEKDIAAAQPGEILHAFKSIYQAHQLALQTDENYRRIVELELKAIPAVARMELVGIKIDKVQLDLFGEQLDTQIVELQSSIYKDVGHEFNIGSPKQVSEVLFAERNLPGGKKNKGGGYSTNERVLRDLVSVDPVVEKILKYREVSKLLSTYVRPLPSYINKTTHRVHGNFNQIGAVTGRFSSDKPNLQNIPIRDELGQSIRKAFVAEPGKLLISFDYSQQELRLLAELSKEPRLVEAFRTGQDIHSLTAADLFGIEIDEVTKDQRRVGKTVNFGIVYGMGGFGLADRLKIPAQQANEFVKMYFQRFPLIKEYFDKLIDGAKLNPYIYTLLGRPRSTNLLQTGNFMVREAAKREIMNFPLQGSAADFMKKAMSEVSDLLTDYPANIVLQIHDELLIEYDAQGRDVAELKQDELFNKFGQSVYNVMREIAQLSVPFDVESKIGHNWLEMQQLTFDN